MKPTFHHRPVNGPFEDPCLYIRLLREKRALLFDLGSINSLSPGDIMKITDVFVTHTHIDHFIGFDHLLRNILGRPEPLNIYGPACVIDCVQGKLRGYTWNLIKMYPLKIEVFGISEGAIRQVSFHAARGLEPEEKATIPFGGPVLRDEYFAVKAAILSHEIDCVAYSLEEDFHINIDKSALERMGLPVGPWLGEFKKKLRAGAPAGETIRVAGGVFGIGELAEKIAIITEGQKLAYVMDASPTRENIEKIVSLAKDADTLYMEAYFLEEDRKRAEERNHLTAKIAGLVAKKAGVKNLAIMHHSPKYLHEAEKLAKEASEAFGAPLLPNSSHR